jgi:hypothetical protein
MAENKGQAGGLGTPTEGRKIDTERAGVAENGEILGSVAQNVSLVSEVFLLFWNGIGDKENSITRS